MIELNLCYPPQSTLSLNFDEEITGNELKNRLFSVLSIETGSDLRLVCAGKVIQDHLSLSSQGLIDKSKIYISCKKTLYSQDPSPILKQPNSKSENDPLMGPLLKFLSDNPELYQQMILSNPQMQQLIEKNPELGHALSDPTTLKSMLNAATNPRAYNEMLRGHDRAMSNLENIPEGFSHLKRIYSTLQEPMYDALIPQTKPISIKPNDNPIRKNTTTSEPIPNPWAPPPPLPSPQLHSVKPRQAKVPLYGFKSHSHKRKLSEGEDEKLLTGSMETMRILSPLNDSDLKEKFKNELAVLHKLGYEQDEEENIPALLASNGHVSSAIDRIVNDRSRSKN